ncbi:alanine racemase [Streptomyces virginiae]|uniref:alanine racemase n=1 Tax=Streptomyces virginiae TaxID=1961 RepID=UPI0036E60439
MKATPPVRVHLDLARAEDNIIRLHTRAAARGVGVRSHVKGHRTVELALRQIAAGATGIAATQLAQARRYVAAGIRDVVVAHPWPDPWRWRLIAELAQDCDLSAHVVDVTGVRGLAAAVRATGPDAVLGVRIQLGTGYDARATSDEEVLAVARAVAAEDRLRLDGVTAYQALLDPGAASDPAAAGRATAAYSVRTGQLLRRAGFACPVVAVGGTPTAGGALDTPGVTEICSGAYALGDAGLAALPGGRAEDVAVSVVALDAEAADAVLDAHPYPWQRPGDHQRLATRAPRGTRLRPPHICALTPQVDAMTVYARDEEGLVGTWQLVNDQDVPPR